MRSVISSARALLFAGAAAVFAFACYGRYWRSRDCFNELGRCYDPVGEQVYVEQAGLVWGLFTVACLVLCVVFGRHALRRRRL